MRKLNRLELRIPRVLEAVADGPFAISVLFALALVMILGGLGKLVAG